MLKVQLTGLVILCLFVLLGQESWENNLEFDDSEAKLDGRREDFFIF